MQFEWQVNEDDIKFTKEFVVSHADNSFVKMRLERNLAAPRPVVDSAEVWKQMAGMRMTSAQRSGPNSPVATFLRTTPFPLSYEKFTGEPDGDRRRNLIAKALRAHGGIRWPDQIAKDLCTNFDTLNADKVWATTLKRVNALGCIPEARMARMERKVARFLQRLLRGFGPKQSRNLLQSLGLTRYEIPIDRRITKWLNGFGFPVPLSARSLGDLGYYEFVLDGIQALCAASGVYPCVLDAAIFASVDGDAWTEENTIY